MPGITDALVANIYRRTSDGRTLFCPWGNLGRAYIVPPEREAELTTFLKRFYLAMFAIIVILAPVLHWWLLALTPILSGIIYYKFWSFSRTLTVDTSPPPPVSRTALFTNQARATGRLRLWLLLIMSLAFVAIGIWMRSTGAPQSTLVIVFFGLCAIVFAAQLIALSRNR